MVDPFGAGTGGDYNALLDYHKRFTPAKDLATSNDAAELQNAMDSIQDGCLRGGYDETDTQKAIEKLVERLDEIAKLLESHLKPIYLMHDFAKDIKKDVVPGWAKVLEQFDAVLSEIDTLGIPTWQGASGEAYRTHVQNQRNDVMRQRNLGEHGKEAINWVADMQQSLNDAVKGYADPGRISAACETAAKPPESFSKGSWFNPGANSQEFSFQFYTRTAAMINAFGPMADFAAKITAGEGWSESAEGIAKTLGNAYDQMERDKHTAPTPATDGVQVTLPPTIEIPSYDVPSDPGNPGQQPEETEGTAIQR